jgi:hypothetical protein
MNYLRFAALAIVLGLSTLVWPAAPVAACSCLPPPPPADAFVSATAVFHGRVAQVEPAPEGRDSFMGSILVRFQVDQSWKGPGTAEIQLRTARDSAACGYSFQPGADYLVYASGDSGSLTTNLCSRTAAGRPAADMAFLESTRPAPDEMAPRE